MIKLTPTSFISNNNTLKAFEIDGLLHPVQPISQLVILSLHNLKADTSETFNLKDEVNFALKVSSVRVDVARDDQGSPGGRQPTITVNIEMLSDTNRLIEKTVFTFQDIVSNQSTHVITPAKLNNFIIEPDQKYRITPVGTQMDINQLKFFCEPVYLLKEVNVVFVGNDNSSQSNQ